MIKIKVASFDVVVADHLKAATLAPVQIRATRASSLNLAQLNAVLYFIRVLLFDLEM